MVRGDTSIPDDFVSLPDHPAIVEQARVKKLAIQIVKSISDVETRNATVLALRTGRISYQDIITAYLKQKSEKQAAAQRRAKQEADQRTLLARAMAARSSQPQPGAQAARGPGALPTVRVSNPAMAGRPSPQVPRVAPGPGRVAVQPLPPVMAGAIAPGGGGGSGGGSGGSGANTGGVSTANAKMLAAAAHAMRMRQQHAMQVQQQQQAQQQQQQQQQQSAGHPPGP